MAFDLENFPTREMAKRMVGMVSPIYDKSYVAKWIYEAMSLYLEIAKQATDDLKTEAFPETCTWSIGYWEQAYGIPDGTGMPIEERRKRITKKRNYRRPMNPARLASLVKEVCGRDAKIIENVAPHTFQLEVYQGEDPIDYEAIYRTLREAKQSQKAIGVCMTTRIGVRVRVRIAWTDFPYVPCGTKPDINRSGKIGDGGLMAEIITLSGCALYKICGQVRLP